VMDLSFALMAISLCCILEMSQMTQTVQDVHRTDSRQMSGVPFICFLLCSF